MERKSGRKTKKLRFLVTMPGPDCFHPRPWRRCPLLLPSRVVYVLYLTLARCKRKISFFSNSPKEFRRPNEWSLPANPALRLVRILGGGVQGDPKCAAELLRARSRGQQARPALERICLEAYRKRIVIVASGRNPRDKVYPASFRTVIGVCWKRDCSPDDLVYYPGMPVEFGAYGRPRPLPGLPENRNFCGSSFAAARVTALAARLLDKNPRAGVRWVRERLKEQATTGGWES